MGTSARVFLCCLRHGLRLWRVACRRDGQVREHATSRLGESRRDEIYPSGLCVPDGASFDAFALAAASAAAAAALRLASSASFSSHCAAYSLARCLSTARSASLGSVHEVRIKSTPCLSMQLQYRTSTQRTFVPRVFNHFFRMLL